MPNHVTNVLTFKGATLDEVFAIVSSGKQVFDFNNIIPVPEELNITSGSFPPGEEGDRMRRLYAENVKNYGYQTWYEFCNDRWGTKWNAYDIGVDVAGQSISFNTAWSTPAPIIDALSQLMPDVTIHVEYADEDIGYNCGIYEYLNGDCILDESKEGDIPFACEIKGYNYEDYMSER